MTKARQVLKPDIVLKNYWNDNRRFADLFNAVLFHGTQIIRPEELAEADTEESFLQEHREYAESIKASRDSVNMQKVCEIRGSDGLTWTGASGEDTLCHADADHGI